MVVIYEQQPVTIHIVAQNNSISIESGANIQNDVTIMQGVQEVNGIVGPNVLLNAIDIPYDGTSVGSSQNNVQDAIDDIYGTQDDLGDLIATISSNVDDISDAIDDINNDLTILESVAITSLTGTQGILVQGTGNARTISANLTFGSSYVSNNSLGVSTNNTATFATKVSIPSTNFNSGVYLVSAYCELSIDSTSTLSHLELLYDGSVIATQRQEPSDVLNLFQFNVSIPINITQGLHNFTLQFRRQAGTGIVSVQNAYIYVYRIL